jgi:hypothetical protein
MQYKNSNKIWIQSKRTKQQAMVIAYDPSRTIDRSGLFQGRSKRTNAKKLREELLAVNTTIMVRWLLQGRHCR